MGSHGNKSLNRFHKNPSREAQMIRTRSLTPFVLLFALATAAPSPLAAAEIQTLPAQASKFVQDMGSRATVLLARYDGRNASQLQTELRKLIHESFNLDLIGNLVLGPTLQTA